MGRSGSFGLFLAPKSKRNCCSRVNLFSETSLVHQVGMAADEACVNCLVYGWTPSEAKITSRCSRCKLFYYCSKECQVEHYKKTHKHFCKAIFAPTSAENVARLQHDETTCRFCILEASAGKDVFKDDNPYYVCVENPSNALLCNIPMEKIVSYTACSLTTKATGNDGEERPDRLIIVSCPTR